jgi:WS/DGAT/MGAT family acyltransferase
VNEARLSAIESAYLALEERGMPIHVGSLATFEGNSLLDRCGELRVDALRARVAARLEQFPRLRQRATPVPLQLGRSVWVDDPDFDVADHVVVEHLPAPGDEAALTDLASDLHMRPFRADRPMWELAFVPGLPGGRVAVIERIHHSIVDGVAGVDAATILLDVERDAPQRIGPAWTPRQHPPTHELVRRAVCERAAQPLRLAAGAVTALGRPATAARRAREVLGAIVGVADHGLVAASSSINAPVSSERTLSLLRQRLRAVKDAGAQAGATVNDVILTAVAGGLRSLLLGRGERLDADLVHTVLVPVSLRDASERGALGNRVGALFLPLPIGIGDPEVRLRTIAHTTAAMKARREVTTSRLLLEAADLLPPRLIAPLTGLLDVQPFVNLVVTNVPGPPFPLYAMGAEMLEAFPIVPIAGNLTLGVAVLSYNGTLNLSVTADRRRCADVEAFTTGLERAFSQLGARAAETPAEVAG